MLTTAMLSWLTGTAGSAARTDFEAGGHFAALEVPELLVGDVREFFRANR
jgi:hypothetical protein